MFGGLQSLAAKWLQIVAKAAAVAAKQLSNELFRCKWFHTMAKAAKVLVRGQALRAKAGNDALHIAVATVHRVPFLVTWNCRHLANAVLRKRIEALCAEQGFAAPVICTPEELLEVD